MTICKLQHVLHWHSHCEYAGTSELAWCSWVTESSLIAVQVLDTGKRYGLLLDYGLCIVRVPTADTAAGWLHSLPRLSTGQSRLAGEATSSFPELHDQTKSTQVIHIHMVATCSMHMQHDRLSGFQRIMVLIQHFEK